MKHIWRIRFISIGILAIALILVSKLYFLQIVHGPEFRDRAEHQYVQPTQLVFDRGTIFFQNKDGTPYSAATLKSGFIVSINPKLIASSTPAEAAYEKLSKIIPLDHDNFITRATKQNDSYEEIAKKVDQDKGKQIEALKIPGVSIYKDKWRVYPGNKLGAHTLGLVGYKGDVLAGRYGLESYYEDVLRRDTETVYVNFFAEIFSNINRSIVKRGELEGDIVTTIEPNVLLTLERELAAVKTKWNSDQVGGIVIDPKTGEIYAMASLPNFDPNTFQNEKSSAVFSNPLVEDVREMGSIIKPLTMAIGLDAKAVTARTTYNDEGFLILNTARISNYDGKGRGVVNMQEVLNQSLNTGVAFVVQRTGKEKFREYMYNFGLGEETGIDLPNEAHGLIDNLKSPRDIEYATASYGQGIAMTPIATVRALSALANGGTLPQPHLVKRINYKVGFSKDIVYPEGRRVIKKETSEEISRMLVEVVDKALKEGKAKIAHTRVAAKTGTAQIANPAGGGYYQDRYLHSFFGYFPAYEPRFLIFLYNVNPKGVEYASETLTDPFFNVTKFLINYYQIPPDR